MSNTSKKPQSKPVIQDAQFSEEDIQALNLGKELNVDDDGADIEIGSMHPMAIHDGIMMDTSGGISLLGGGRDFSDDFNNRYYYD